MLCTIHLSNVKVALEIVSGGLILSVLVSVGHHYGVSMLHRCHLIASVYLLHAVLEHARIDSCNELLVWLRDSCRLSEVWFATLARRYIVQQHQLLFLLVANLIVEASRHYLIWLAKVESLVERCLPDVVSGLQLRRSCALWGTHLGSAQGSLDILFCKAADLIWLMRLWLSR